MILGQTIDLNGNYISKAKVETLPSDPSSSVYLGSLSGAMYYNSTSAVYRIHNGLEWVNVVNLTGTVGRVNVTYTGSPLVANIDIDSAYANQMTSGYLPLSGGTITGNLITTDISANSFSNTNFTGSRVLATSGVKIVETNITTAELNYISGLSALAQNQLSGLSATKVDKTTSITAGTGLTGGGDLSTNRTLSLAPTGTSGTYTKVTTNNYGQVTAGTTLTSGDIPTLPTSKIQETATDRFVSDTQIGQWNSVYSSVNSNSADWETAATNSHTHSNKTNLDLINQSLNTSASPTFAGLTVGSVSNTEISYLDSVSANIQTQFNTISGTKTDKTTTITAGTGLTGGGDLSTNRTISLATTGTSGTYTKVTTNAYGQVISGTTLTSGDIPQLPATKIGTGNISNQEFEYLDGVSANIQTQLNNMSTTVGLSAYQARSEKGVSLGYAALDSNSKLYTSAIPDFILGQLKYGGSWNANTNTPTLSSAPSMSGTFYIVNVSGTTKPNGLNPNTSASLWPTGNVEWNVGDWIVSDGTYYDKVDNTDALYSWNGRLGAVVPVAGDYNASQITNTASGNITAVNVQNAINELDSEKTDKTTTITAGTGLTGGGDLSTNRTISLATTGTSGTYTKVTTNNYGQVTAGTTLTSGDIPTLPTSKIQETTTDRFVSDTQIGQWSSTYTTVNSNSADWETAATNSHTHSNKTFIDNINQNLSTNSSPWFNEVRLQSQTAAIFTSARPPFSIRQSMALTDEWRIYGEGLQDDGRLIIETADNGDEPIYLSFRAAYSNGRNDVYKFSPTSLNVSYLTSGRVVVTDGSKNIVSSPITTTELNYLDSVSANIQTQLSSLSGTKADNTTTITAGTGLTGGGDLSTNRTISLSTTGTAGTYTKVTTNAYGQVISGTTLTSGDIPQLPATKIGSGNISNQEFEYLDGVSANIQTQLNNLKTSATRFTSAINISIGVQSILVNHNLGYLRPTVKIYDEVFDQEIIITPIYISTNQLSLPITSSRAFTGAILEVYI